MEICSITTYSGLTDAQTQSGYIPYNQSWGIDPSEFLPWFSLSTLYRSTKCLDGLSYTMHREISDHVLSAALDNGLVEYATLGNTEVYDPRGSYGVLKLIDFDAPDFRFVDKDGKELTTRELLELEIATSIVDPTLPIRLTTQLELQPNGVTYGDKYVEVTKTIHQELYEPLQYAKNDISPVYTYVGAIVGKGGLVEIDTFYSGMSYTPVPSGITNEVWFSGVTEVSGIPSMFSGVTYQEVGPGIPIDNTGKPIGPTMVISGTGIVSRSVAFRKLTQHMVNRRSVRIGSIDGTYAETVYITSIDDVHKALWRLLSYYCPRNRLSIAANINPREVSPIEIDDGKKETNSVRRNPNVSSNRILNDKYSNYDSMYSPHDTYPVQDYSAVPNRHGTAYGVIPDDEVKDI